MAKLGPSTDLESVLENRSVMLRFRRFLDTIYSVENMTFWLEAGTKHSSALMVGEVSAFAAIGHLKSISFGEQKS